MCARGHIDKSTYIGLYRLLRTNKLRKTLVLIVVCSWNGFGKFRGTSIWTMKRRHFSAAEMADLFAILPRSD